MFECSAYTSFIANVTRLDYSYAIYDKEDGKHYNVEHVVARLMLCKKYQSNGMHRI